MVTSKAATVEEYLDELPPERREVVSEVRQTILDNLPEGFVESMNWGMISYEIPLERYPDTYNKKPLAYAALAAQKNHYSIYLMGCYADSEQEAVLKEGFEQAGKRLDMGKSCVRFRKLEDIPMDAIARVIASTTPEQFITMYEHARKK
ncbi:MAG: DUF1801 domain-containing protein [Chloroflexota bacterium]|nr:DUF1801 domain-containing protein [Chloroflexota bacterium]